nr:MAG TPA: hypothetical protein [Caudoviricetes sp.]
MTFLRFLFLNIFCAPSIIESVLAFLPCLMTKLNPAVLFQSSQFLSLVRMLLSSILKHSF